MKNWKTTLAGLFTLAFAIAPIWAAPELAHKLQATAAACAACGLFAAKDGNTPGT